MHDELTTQLQRQQRYAATLRLAPLDVRRGHLRALSEGIARHVPALLDALQADLGKPAAEAWTSEIGLVQRDIRHALRQLKRWTRPRRTRTPLIIRPASARVVMQPLGVVLIIGPWNYPFQLLFTPFVAALAAGNAVCLKPSELAPRCADAVAALCTDVFEENHVVVKTGNAALSAALCELPFDHIFFTGSTATGRKIARAAAENLVPVTLELGGKSPCVIAPDAPLQPTVRRIVWGKSLNAGQTCIAPDYLLVPESRSREVLPALCREATHWPRVGTRIISRAHFDRLRRLLADCDVLCGGGCDRAALTIETTFVRIEDESHPLMQEEIFGPIAPVLTYASDEEAMGVIQRHPSPLAVYLFTRSRERIRRYRDEIACGGLCVNDTIAQALPADLPFGGVGASGYGRYHGRSGFETFSNSQAVLRRGYKPDLSFRYPPYRTPLTMLKRAYRFLAR